MKRALQGFAAVLMLEALFPRPFETPKFHPKVFVAGALIFLSTFITWKPDRKNNDLG
jgi:hypothetical protein